MAWALSKDYVLDKDRVQMVKTHPFKSEKKKRKETDSDSEISDAPVMADFVREFDPDADEIDKLIEKECLSDDSD